MTLACQKIANLEVEQEPSSECQKSPASTFTFLEAPFSVSVSTDSTCTPFITVEAQILEAAALLEKFQLLNDFISDYHVHQLWARGFLLPGCWRPAPYAHSRPMAVAAVCVFDHSKAACVSPRHMEMHEGHDMAGYTDCHSKVLPSTTSTYRAPESPSIGRQVSFPLLEMGKLRHVKKTKGGAYISSSFKR